MVMTTKYITFILLLVVLMHTTTAWISSFRKTFDEESLRQLLEKINGPPRFHPKAIKRGCYINAGLSHGCDLANMMQDKYDYNKFQSFAGPGK
uniref:Uncharacterized protein n=1 Tax=Parastrongyloides trichosuri TaxID=131310 RepID=A0A0N4ZKK1_PARTI